MINFADFEKSINEKAKESDQIKLNNVSEVFHVAYYQTPIEKIDFNSFTVRDCLLAMEVQEQETYSREVDDIEEEIVYTDHHPFSYMRELDTLIEGLNSSPKVYAPSRYKFI